MLYGNNQYLDRYGCNLIKTRNFSARTIEQNLFPLEGYALWVDGEYLIQCIMPDSVAAHLAFFFRSVQNIHEFEPEIFADIFRMKVRCSVTVEKNRAKSKAKREQLKSLFNKAIRSHKL